MYDELNTSTHATSVSEKSSNPIISSPILKSSLYKVNLTTFPLLLVILKTSKINMINLQKKFQKFENYSYEFVFLQSDLAILLECILNYLLYYFRQLKTDCSNLYH